MAEFTPPPPLPVPPTPGNAQGWVIGGAIAVLGVLILNNRSLRSNKLEGLPQHHQNEAHRYAARATTSSCSSKSLQALLAAQTAYVHAKESGNTALLNRLEKKRDLMFERSSACCFGGVR